MSKKIEDLQKYLEKYLEKMNRYNHVVTFRKAEVRKGKV